MSTTPETTTPELIEIDRSIRVTRIHKNELTTSSPVRKETTEPEDLFDTIYEEDGEDEYDEDEKNEVDEYEQDENSEECEEGEFAHMPGDCTMFRRCVHHKYMEFSCRPGTHWNDAIDTCDHPDSAKCTDTQPKASRYKLFQ